VRTFHRSAVLAVVVAATLLGGAANASAEITLHADAESFILGNATGSNETAVGINGTNQITFINNTGIVLTQDAVDIGQCAAGPATNEYDCSGAQGDIQAQYGGGNDSIGFDVCFSTGLIDLGDGSNRYDGAGCAGFASAIAVGGGSGQDTLVGSSDAGTTTSETFFGEGGNDTLQGYEGNDDIHGGEGTDIIDGGSGNDGLFGDGGNDEISGRAGNDNEDGGPGDDSMGLSRAACCGEDDDQGADSVRGGAGTDTLTLEDHSGGMTINLDDQANDGSAGEGDNIHTDIESITGTRGDDLFTGTLGRDTFTGHSGNDEIHGAGGDDELSGSTGDDRMFGDAGNDKLQGYEGADQVDGGSGSDQLYGDRGTCTLFCSFDADQLFARDGERDTVDCGGGADAAQVDGLDIVAFCASVDRQSLPAAGGPGGGAAAALALKVGKSIKLKALLKRGLAVRLRCAAACKVVATLSFKGKRLGVGRKTLRKAGAARLAVKVGKKARRRVRRLRGKKLTLRVKVTSAGKTTALTRKVTLKR